MTHITLADYWDCWRTYRSVDSLRAICWLSTQVPGCIAPTPMIPRGLPSRLGLSAGWGYMLCALGLDSRVSCPLILLSDSWGETVIVFSFASWDMLQWYCLSSMVYIDSWCGTGVHKDRPQLAWLGCFYHSMARTMYRRDISLICRMDLRYLYVYQSNGNIFCKKNRRTLFICETFLLYGRQIILSVQYISSCACHVFWVRSESDCERAILLYITVLPAK